MFCASSTKTNASLYFKVCFIFFDFIYTITVRGSYRHTRPGGDSAARNQCHPFLKRPTSGPSPTLLQSALAALQAAAQLLLWDFLSPLVIKAKAEGSVTGKEKEGQGEGGLLGHITRKS